MRMFNANRSLKNRLYLGGKKEEYKTCVNKAKRRYQRQEGDMLANMKRANPRGFYKLFRKTKKGGNKTNLTAQDFCRYFSDLMSNNEQTGQDERVTPESNVIFEELDIYFSEGEIQEQICKLKTQKSPGIDCLLNEMFIKCKDIFIPIFKKLFDHILSTGIYPEEWSKGIVIPVFKKGDSSDAGNYRPITLISHLAKLFTAILNNRLLKWCKTNGCLTDAQFGFKPGYSTVDAVFALHSIISDFLSRKKKLY